MAVVTKSGCLHHENPSHSPIIFVEADTLPGLPGQAWAYILLSSSFHGESKTTLHLVMAV